MKLQDLKVGDCYLHKIPGFSYMFEVERVAEEKDLGPSVVCKHFVSVFCTDYKFEVTYKEHSIHFLFGGEDPDLQPIDKNEFYKYVALSRTTRTTFKNLIV